MDKIKAQRVANIVSGLVDKLLTNYKAGEKFGLKHEIEAIWQFALEFDDCFEESKTPKHLIDKKVGGVTV